MMIGIGERILPLLLPGSQVGSLQPVHSVWTVYGKADGPHWFLFSGAIQVGFQEGRKPALARMVQVGFQEGRKPERCRLASK